LKKTPFETAKIRNGGKWMIARTNETASPCLEKGENTKKKKRRGRQHGKGASFERKTSPRKKTGGGWPKEI